MTETETSIGLPAIRVEGLSKHYDGTAVVDDVSFTVDTGEVVGILGPNGAGKTTTVEILEGHRARTAGSVEVLGVDPWTGGRAFRERIGIVLQSAGIERELTPREALRGFRDLYPRRRDIDEVLRVVGLSEKSGARIGTLSGGQRRRLDLALGLIGDPDLLFLDEPTTGFDPAARREAWALIERLRGLGKTVLLTTHYLDEAQNLADRVLVLSRGRIVASGAPGEIGSHHSRTIVRFRLPAGIDPEGLPDCGGQVTVEGREVQIAMENATRGLHDLTRWAVAAGIELEGLEIGRRSLEEAYLEVIGER